MRDARINRLDANAADHHPFFRRFHHKLMRGDALGAVVQALRSGAFEHDGDGDQRRPSMHLTQELFEQLTADLSERERQLATLISNLPGMAYRCPVEKPWPFQFVSDGVEPLTGYSAGEFIAGEVTWADLVHPDDLVALDAEIERSIRERRAFSMAYRIVHRSGDVRWVHERGRAFCDTSGTPLFLEGFIGDVTEQKESELKIRWAAEHDALTGLPNRAGFKSALERELGRAAVSGTKVGLLLVDIDRLKTINDKFGHDVGDLFLQTFAERLRHAARGLDFVARLGDDEFAVVMPDPGGTRSIESDGKALLHRLRQPFACGPHVLDCRASIGAVTYPEHGVSAQELLRHAEMALYTAKQSTLGRVAVFRSEMRAAMQRQNSMLAQAREALDENRITAFYQPKIDLGSNRLIGFEALLRWRHPRLGIQLPGTIAAAFDDLELAVALTDRMLDLVVRDMRTWLDAGVDFGHVALNASAADFRQSGVAEKILQRLSEADIPPHCLALEITESVFLGEQAHDVGQSLNRLCDAGVEIALDDFGTGYASLSHLKQFPVDVIKIDRSFVRDLEQDPDDAAIIRALISLGQSLGIKTVAEGVETEAQLALLRTQGCNVGQGFLFGRAMPANRVPRFAARWRPPEP